MDRWSYTFQNAAILTRILNMKHAVESSPESKVFITERSYQTDKHVFAKMLHEDGKLNDMEMKLYDMWFDNFTKDLPIHIILWLTTDPDLCLDRIHVRNRPGEEHIELKYLDRLRTAHEEWLGGKNTSDTVIIKVDHKLNAEDICKLYIDNLI